MSKMPTIEELKRRERLAVYAPDLLNALIMCCDALGKWVERRNDPTVQYVLENARTTIALATDGDA